MLNSHISDPNTIGWQFVIPAQYLLKLIYNVMCLY